jgi:hypothetical protein
LRRAQPPPRESISAPKLLLLSERLVNTSVADANGATNENMTGCHVSVVSVCPVESNV